MSGSDNRYTKAEYYINRELSWLEFNCRVLGEAKDKTLPLFERLKFLSITASNLDEFFMVRVASLKIWCMPCYHKADVAGLRPAEQLAKIGEKTHELVRQQYMVYNRSLLPLLSQHGLRVIEAHEEMTQEEQTFADRYFQENIYPVLTPMAVDSSRPFPLIYNKSLNIAALLQKKDGDEDLDFATVQVPRCFQGSVELPPKDGVRRGILLEEIIERNIQSLFLNYNIITAHPYRVMRNADLSIDEEEAEDLLKEIQKQLKKRQWGEAIRLEIEEKADKRLLKRSEKGTGTGA